MKSLPLNSAEKFDTHRANEYGRQSRIALAGYDACNAELVLWGHPHAMDLKYPRLPGLEVMSLPLREIEGLVISHAREIDE